MNNLCLLTRLVIMSNVVIHIVHP